MPRPFNNEKYLSVAIIECQSNHSYNASIVFELEALPTNSYYFFANKKWGKK